MFTELSGMGIIVILSVILAAFLVGRLSANALLSKPPDGLSPEEMDIWKCNHGRHSWELWQKERECKVLNSQNKISVVAMVYSRICRRCGQVEYARKKIFDANERD